MEFLTDSSLPIFLIVFLGPFLQEDVAVLYAASLSASTPAYFPTLFFIILAGLFLSDIWKYWIGWAALSNTKARAFTEKKHIANMQSKVQKYTMTTLFTARFVPFVRVPIYVACGYFKVPYLKFCAIVGLTATIYTIIIFAIIHGAEAALGERFIWLFPIIAIAAALLFTSQRFLKRKMPAHKG